MAGAHQEIIAITHFINPHLFWYRKIAHYNDEYPKILKLEAELEVFYKEQGSAKRNFKDPPINSLVAVKFLSWNKLIRARLDHIATFNKSNGGVYILWAIDYGFPFQAKEEHIFSLPKELTKPFELIHCGGLVDILPCAKEFIMTGIKKIIKDKFHQRACKVMQGIINEAYSIEMTEKYRASEHTWGNLIIINDMGEKINMADHLVHLELAIADESKFHQAVSKLETVQISPWMTNEGNTEFWTNKVYFHETKIEKTSEMEGSEFGCRKHAKLKVEEWYSRNKDIAPNTNSKMEPPLEYSAPEPLQQKGTFSDQNPKAHTTTTGEGTNPKS